MVEVKPLAPAELCRRCDPATLPFATTAEVDDLPELIGQERAVEAVEFGVGIRRDGFNVFALGPPGVGKHESLLRLLAQAAEGQPAPSDWCYVNNFADARAPRALRLPPGRGMPLKRGVDTLIDELRAAIPAAFESEDYRSRRKLLDHELAEHSERAFGEVQKAAQARRIAVIRTPVGVALAPTRDGEVMEPDEFEKLPAAEQERIKSDIAGLQEQLQQALGALPALASRHREAMRKLSREVTSFAVRHLMSDLRSAHADLPDALAWLDTLEQDVIDNTDTFLPAEKGNDPLANLLGRRGEGRGFRRYAVNVIVDQSDARGAPVVYEDHPAHPALVGRLEHLAEFGNLVTDFSLIRAGALHRANGGYLVLDARRVLTQPQAWEELKRALRSRLVRIQSLAEALGFAGTVTLEPEPIPLDVKVVLMGDRLLYYLLCEYDPEFQGLFKVAADFDDECERTPEGEARYARLLATLARRSDLRPLDRTAVARAVEHGSRLAGDSGKLSTRVARLSDLLREADYQAGRRAAEVVTDADVQAAVDAQVRRAGRIQERVLEMIRDGTVRIDTRGAAVGQVNGLSVIQLGGFLFGRPARITASVRLGPGQVVDIEREVALGGPIHSKGVLILSGYLGARYSAERPLSLGASLVFEQSYGGVEGDSASCAELVALLSALARVPIRQDLAVTGSIDQHGRVQAVGGVSEKIEGFFDVCRARGLTGAEGVLIPAANVRHLMLRDDVVQAVAGGRFNVWPVTGVDQALERLTGLPAGERGEDGAFPAGSFNARVEARLMELAESARSFRTPEKGHEAAARQGPPPAPGTPPPPAPPTAPPGPRGPEDRG
jgi:lon-related putative ATP-dependent protease